MTPSSKASPTRIAFFIGSAVFSIVIGFLAVSPPTAEEWVRRWGYYYMLGLFATFCYYACAIAHQRRDVLWRWIRSPGAVGWVVLGAAGVLIWLDVYKHKVLFDEYVLQGTAFHMHATKEIGTIIRAYDIQGTWLPIDTFLDKRPYFFTFLLSLVHDLIGYRLSNVYVLNSLLAPCFVGLVYWFARTLMSRSAAFLVVALLGTLPLLAQQVSGAGMELHNLTMLVLVAVASVLYLRVSSDARLGFLITATLLLAQSRYESVVFVLPVATVIVIGWRRTGRISLPWIAVAAPVLLVPYAWHNRIVADTPLLWQLGQGQSSRFSLEYLDGNLEGLWRFLFDASGRLANSWYLSSAGFLGVGVGLFQTWRWARDPQRPRATPAMIALIAMAAGIVANLILLMFYYWSRFDDVVASRFALPLCLLLALLAGLAMGSFDGRRWSATRVAWMGLALWFVGWGVPAAANRLYTTQNLVMQELEWEYEQLQKLDSSLLFISNKSTIPFVLWRVPSVINGQARLRATQIAFHLNAGTFKEVIVAQSLLPTSAVGDFAVAPEDVMPAAFRLETIGEKRFGARWARLSRVVAIDLERSEQASVDAIQKVRVSSLRR